MSALVFINSSYLSNIVNILFRQDTKWYTLIGGIVLILVNLRFLMSLISAQDSYDRFQIVKLTDNGEINISNETIKSLALKTISEIKGVRDPKIFIKPENDKININIKVFIMPDVNIPSVVGEIQNRVKTYIESIVEVPVGEIRVSVIDIASSTKLRLE